MDKNIVAVLTKYNSNVGNIDRVIGLYVACEQAFCLEKGWEPVDKRLGPSFSCLGLPLFFFHLTCTLHLLWLKRKKDTAQSVSFRWRNYIFLEQIWQGTQAQWLFLIAWGLTFLWDGLYINTGCTVRLSMPVLLYYFLLRLIYSQKWSLWYRSSVR